MQDWYPCVQPFRPAPELAKKPEIKLTNSAKAKGSSRLQGITGRHNGALMAGKLMGDAHFIRINLIISTKLAKREGKTSNSKPSRSYRRKPIAQANMAERVGFEPTVRLHARRFSRPVHSTTLPPLRVNEINHLGTISNLLVVQDLNNCAKRCRKRGFHTKPQGNCKSFFHFSVPS